MKWAMKIIGAILYCVLFLIVAGIAGWQIPAWGWAVIAMIGAVHYGSEDIKI